MQYPNITKAEFIDRPNRFIAHVTVDGHDETVHVKNTGRCKEFLIPGCTVYLTASDNPARKTRYDLVAVIKDNGLLINIDSQAPNKVVAEYLQNQSYDVIIQEYTYGDSRIDFYMEKNRSQGKVEKYLMEVKGCTLERSGIGYFPDAPTERGVKHIHELIRAKKEGYHAILAFVIQMDGISEVHPNIETHPEFGAAMKEAEKAGVEVWFFQCHVELDSLRIINQESSDD